jgi:hypothetical protein
MEEIFLIVVVNVGQIFWVVLAQSALHLLMISSDRTFGHPLPSLRFTLQFCLKLLKLSIQKFFVLHGHQKNFLKFCEGFFRYESNTPTHISLFQCTTTILQV